MSRYATCINSPPSARRRFAASTTSATRSKTSSLKRWRTTMAVYEHTYKQYAGPETPRWSRFLILPRHSYRGIFQSKLFIAIFAACFICPLVSSVLIYLHHNAEALAVMELAVRRLVPIDAPFFENLVIGQGMSAFFITLLIGPPLI